MVHACAIAARIVAFLVGFTGFVWFLGGLYGHDFVTIATGLSVIGIVAAPFVGHHYYAQWYLKRATRLTQVTASRSTRW